jgi:glycosyltransferase involved in cell wall biosynthesis
MINKTPAESVDPMVSVIIPAYKVALFIRETLGSVFAQTFTDYEVIVINDGSPDTRDLERELEPYRNRIVYIRQDNRGAGAARNAGLRVARGRLVAFLDGDDAWLPNHLKEQINFIQSDGGYDLVYANGINFGDRSPGGTCMDTNPSNGAVTFESVVRGVCCVTTSTVVARRESIFSAGLFDEKFRNSQDFDLWLRLARQREVRLNYQRAALVRRRVYEGSLASDAIKSLEGELLVLQSTLQWNDLSAAERTAIEQTLKKRRAEVEILRGKRSLLAGEFELASRAFRAAMGFRRDWKLRTVLIGLRFAPQLVQRVYRSRPT